MEEDSNIDVCVHYSDLITSGHLYRIKKGSAHQPQDVVSLKY